MKKIVSNLLITTVFLGVFFLSKPVPVYAAASIYLSPSSKTVNAGSQLSVAIRFNSGSVSINAVQANLSYPTSQLEFVSIDAVGSAFEQQFQNTGGGGSVKIARTTVTPVSGDNLVARVIFKAKSTGTASVNFTSGTTIVRSSDNKEETSTKSGGTYTIASSSTGSSSSETTSVSKPSGSTSTSTSTTTSTSVRKRDTSPPTISSVRVINIGFEKATITWKTNERATSVVEYGISKKLGLIKYDTGLVTTHKVVLPSRVLTLGTRFFYKVSSKDAKGNASSSKLTSFKTKGYGIKLRILDLSGKAVENAVVTLVPGFDTTATDKGGFAIFVDVAAGKHSVNIEVNDQTLAVTIEIKETKKPDEVQNFELKVAAAATTQSNNYLSYAALFIIGVLATLLIGTLWLTKQHLVRAVGR